ncbi:hypothetical protein B0H13DRAFT_2319841 [Mycena leptocephala]|nr:hypothetical protein B0H13DRAFT_2319841 [Mycena leptocephala]
MVHDPPESIVRNVILYPADGGEPRITPMTFNEEGARANPCGIFAINVDLRALYGDRNMYATRQQLVTIHSQPDPNSHGVYDIFYNISPRLPTNVCLARLVGVDPARPGKRPLWRGDVVVVKSEKWPSLKIGGRQHMNYVDIPPAVLDVLNSNFIPKWYNSRAWGDSLQAEQMSNDEASKTEQNWPVIQKFHPSLSGTRSGYDKKTLDKTARMIDRLKTNQAKQGKREELDRIIVCGHYKVHGSSIAQPLRVCGGCRNEKYCSTECQRLAWKEHRSSCKAAEKNGV